MNFKISKSFVFFFRRKTFYRRKKCVRFENRFRFLTVNDLQACFACISCRIRNTTFERPLGCYPLGATGESVHKGEGGTRKKDIGDEANRTRGT